MVKVVKVDLEFTVDEWDHVSTEGGWSVTCVQDGVYRTHNATVVTMRQGKTNTTYVRNMRRKRRQEGKCTTCGSEPDSGFVRCTPCREYSNKMDKRNSKHHYDADVDINYQFTEEGDR